MPAKSFSKLLNDGDIPSKNEWMKYVKEQKLTSKNKEKYLEFVGDSLDSYLQERKGAVEKMENELNDQMLDNYLEGEKEKLKEAIKKCIQSLKRDSSELKPAEKKAKKKIAVIDFAIKNLESISSNITFDIPSRPKKWKTLISEKNKLVAGMYKFDTNEDVDSSAKWLYIRGVRSVITIEYKDYKKTKDAVLKAGMKWYTCFLPDWHAPCVMQLKAYCDLVKKCLKEGGVATHCWGGTGRTGIFLASYLLALKKASNAQEAFKQVRQKYSTEAIEMKAQYNALARFSDFLGKKPSIHYEDSKFDHANGDWHKTDERDYGIVEDPGHNGHNADSAKMNPQIKIIAMNKYGQVMDDREYIGTDKNNYLIEEQDKILQKLNEREAEEKDKVENKHLQVARSAEDSYSHKFQEHSLTHSNDYGYDVILPGSPKEKEKMMLGDDDDDESYAKQYKENKHYYSDDDELDLDDSLDLGGGFDYEENNKYEYTISDMGNGKMNNDDLGSILQTGHQKEAGIKSINLRNRRSRHSSRHAYLVNTVQGLKKRVDVLDNTVLKMTRSRQKDHWGGAQMRHRRNQRRNWSDQDEEFWC